LHPYLPPLIELLESQADPETAAPMKRYMRDKFEFLGIKSPQRKELQKTFIAEHGLPPLDSLDEIIRQLWNLPEREYQYTAMDLLDRCQTKLTPAHVRLLELLIVTKSWWDTVDELSSHQVGRLFIRYPEIRDEHIGRWRKSDNIWLRRVTLLFQMPCKKNTDEALLFELIHENLDSDEFFIQKAIGWALREYSKSNAASVTNFVAQTKLPPLSHREALKWIQNQGLLNNK
jgi:3-methyladenine DNA glycosylase AlkD